MAQNNKKIVLNLSKPALVARINRKLAHEDQQLKATRGERARRELGDYYIVDVNRNLIVAKDCDLVKLARGLGVLKPFERLDTAPL